MPPTNRRTAATVAGRAVEVRQTIREEREEGKQRLRVKTSVPSFMWVRARQFWEFPQTKSCKVLIGRTYPACDDNALDFLSVGAINGAEL